MSDLILTHDSVALSVVPIATPADLRHVSPSMTGTASFRALSKSLAAQLDEVNAASRALVPSGRVDGSPVYLQLHNRRKGHVELRWRGTPALQARHLVWSEMPPILAALPPGIADHLRRINTRANELYLIGRLLSAQLVLCQRYLKSLPVARVR